MEETESVVDMTLKLTSVKLNNSFFSEFLLASGELNVTFSTFLHSSSSRLFNTVLNHDIQSKIVWTTHSHQLPQQTLFNSLYAL